MAQSYFIWNGADCRSKGIILDGPIPIVRPEERVKHIEIPGRSGDLTELEGEDDELIYNSYIQTATIKVQGGYRVREIFNWLKGSGYVTFHGEPDRQQEARIIGAITLNKHSRNLDWWVGECQFYCQPFKTLLTEKKTDITSSGTVIRNTGDVTERPLIVVTCSGSTPTITIGGKSFSVSDCTSGMKFRIDCEAGIVTNNDGTSDWTKWSTGRFPKLQPGDNTVTGSGWSKLEFYRRERFL